MAVDFEKNNSSLSHLEIPRSEKEDAVSDIYKIHLNEEVHDLGNDFCKYYQASNIESQEKYFAIVYDLNFIAPIKTIAFLQKYKVDGLNTIISWSIVRLSSDNREHLVLIVDHYDHTDNLLSYIQKNGSISTALLEKIVEKLNSVFENLSSNGIYGYNVMPHNILMRDDEFLCLREFVDSYPYFYVHNQYIAPELIECMKAARRIASVKPDIYAFGVSLFYAYMGKSGFFDHMSAEEYNENRFEYTTYKYLLNKTKISEKLRHFFRFCMHDDATVRWKPQNISAWLEGKAGKVLHDSIVDHQYTIGFNDRNYSNMKSLAYALFRFWDATGKFIKDNKLFKWARRQQITSDMLEGIKQIVDTSTDAGFVTLASPVNTNQKISKLLSVIDPTGSIRQENMALSAASIPELLQYLNHTKRKIQVEQLVKIIKDELWQQYSNEEAAGSLDRSQAEHLTHLATQLNFNSLYKSVERFIYALNPNLPCLSPLLDGKYVTDIRGLLIALESHIQKNPKNFTLDKHIIGFIAAKLDLKEAISAAILSSFPQFVDHATIRALSVLNVLQQHVPDIKLPNISKCITSDLIVMFEEHLHNVEFKKEIITKLTEISAEGELTNVIKLLSNQQPFINDYNGYHEACKKVKMIEMKINTLNNQDGIFNGALLWGQKMTVLASYILCFLVTVTLLI